VKPLILTLVFAVIATTIGAGWVISQLYSSFHVSSAETDHNLIAYKQLGKAIGLTLDDFPRREEFIAHWEKKSDLQLSFQDRSDFVVPNDIALEFKNGMPLLLQSEGEMSLHLYMANTDQVMSMISSIDRSNQQPFLSVVLTLLFYLVVIAVLLAWLYPLIRRLVMLQKTANRLGTGDLSSRVSLSKYSYIGSIEKDFNRMANQIQKLVDDNQLLSRAVSHNLKTPITRLRMGVDVLEEAKDKSAIEGYFKRINHDLDEMQSLVETLLQYSNLDEFKLRLRTELIDLHQFVPKLIENCSTPEIKIVTSFTTNDIVLNTDPRYLAMSLINVLSNATKHAKSLVEIRIELQAIDAKKSTVAISIEDDGNGISEEDFVHVTKPFWRGKNSTANKGHGMGLAIVARIAEWLKADLIIQNSETLGGASISMIFVSRRYNLSHSLSVAPR